MWIRITLRLLTILAPLSDPESYSAWRGGSRWSQAGKELIYRAPDGNLMSVEVNAAGSAFQAGTAQSLFKVPQSVPWDVSADGKRFLVAAPVSSGAPPASLPFRVVMNWTRLMKR